VISVLYIGILKPNKRKERIDLKKRKIKKKRINRSLRKNMDFL